MLYCIYMHMHNDIHVCVNIQDHEIQVYGYKSVGDPQCLWTFTTKDSVLALTTELEGGRVSTLPPPPLSLSFPLSLSLSLSLSLPAISLIHHYHSSPG